MGNGEFLVGSVEEVRYYLSPFTFHPFDARLT